MTNNRNCPRCNSVGWDQSDRYDCDSVWFPEWRQSDKCKELELDQKRRALAKWFGWVYSDGLIIWMDPPHYRKGITKPEWKPDLLIDQTLGNGGPGTVVGEMRKKKWLLVLFAGLREDTENYAAKFIRDTKAYNILDASNFEYANTPAQAIFEAACRVMEGRKEI